MTISTAMEGITAPRRPAASPAAIPTETFLPRDETPLLSSRRQDGWSAANQRLFLEAIAEGYGVENATYRVGLSAASAYAFRRTAKGATFALGWRAANLVAREAIAETLLVRALEGQVDTYTRADGSTVTRHRFDNGLASRMLARLDRQVEVASDADTHAARLVAQEFDAFLALVERDEGPARAGLFLTQRAGGEDAPDLAPIHALAAADRLARTGVATAGEIDVRDLDPHARAGWSAEQWSRAEAAGLLALAVPAPPAPEPDADAEEARASQHSQHSTGQAREREPVWWDDIAEHWRTRFPPPDGFRGTEEGRYGDDGYERELTPEEEDAVELAERRDRAALRADDAPVRDAWFAALAAEAVQQREGRAADGPEERCTKSLERRGEAAPDAAAGRAGRPDPAFAPGRASACADAGLGQPSAGG